MATPVRPETRAPVVPAREPEASAATTEMRAPSIAATRSLAACSLPRRWARSAMTTRPARRVINASMGSASALRWSVTTSSRAPSTSATQSPERASSCRPVMAACPMAASTLERVVGLPVAGVRLQEAPRRRVGRRWLVASRARAEQQLAGRRRLVALRARAERQLAGRRRLVGARARAAWRRALVVRPRVEAQPQAAPRAPVARARPTEESDPVTWAAAPARAEPARSGSSACSSSVVEGLVRTSAEVGSSRLPSIREPRCDDRTGSRSRAQRACAADMRFDHRRGGSCRAPRTRE